MLNPRILISALMALGLAAPVSAGDGLVPNKVVEVQMQCNTMVGAFEVDPVAARALLPAQYDLALQPSGNALVYLQTSNCDGSGNGEPLGAVSDAGGAAPRGGRPSHAGRGFTRNRSRADGPW